ncbi:MAG: 4Fe-4S cluster-binding domain-containing protein [Collinsella sp.]
MRYNGGYGKRPSKTPPSRCTVPCPTPSWTAPGLRYAAFVQGCSHGCPWLPQPRKPTGRGRHRNDPRGLLADIRANGLVHDVTLSGGEPFEQPKACAALAAELKRNGYESGVIPVTSMKIWRNEPTKPAPSRDRRIGALGGEALHENPEEAMVSGALADIADDLAVGDLLDSIDARRWPLRGVAQVP